LLVIHLLCSRGARLLTESKVAGADVGAVIVIQRSRADVFVLYDRN
jgi:hypothetical protein